MQKKLFLLFIFVFLFNLKIYPQWFQQQTNTYCFISKIKMINANTGYAIGDSSLVLKTTNGGTNWNMLNTGTTHDDFFQGIYFLNADTGWVCGGYMGGMGTSKILKTMNGGLNWTIQYSVPFTFFFSIWFVNSNLGFVGGYDGKYLRTTDGGNNWTEYGVTGADIWTMQFFNSSTGFIAGNVGMIRKTTDGGLSYTLMNSGTNLRIASIFFTDNLNGYAVCDSETVLKTTNTGLNWTSQRHGTNIGYESVFFVNQNTGYAVGNWWQIATYKLIRTTNAGINWTTLAQGEGNPYFDIFFVNENTGWISGYEGLILKTTNAGTTFTSGNETQIPASYELYQNYPNPFNPVTKIKFSLKEEGRLKMQDIKLIVYDILGKKITTLVNEKLNPGTYEVNFNGGNLPSGIYIYKLTAGSHSESRKMLLIK